MVRQFHAYGPSHWVILAVFVLGAALVVWQGRRLTDTRARLLGRVLGAVTAIIYAAILIAGCIPPRIEVSMPLRLTDLATAVAAYALWSQRAWAYALTYYWGLVLSSQALISPVLTGPDFPARGFLAFWSIHLLVVWAAIYLTWGRGMRPTWRSFRVTAMITLSWAAFTMAFNAAVGSNYGFLNQKPSTASLFDLMGPWPWYVVTATALVLTVWALMTWPWQRSAAETGESQTTPR
ncbi:putative conserved membrane protein [Mycobacteroides stephanolepidis]|uniref:Putative conserved membrane protein n=1 Tax=[Mycobacterium] stephanolepidis TaxID=1520670 RepID=A0A1Z4EY06_9MYCO|nr:TIGR02206 family membrane protein [[Mycobacterium] stephanolepidis]BAX97845.1 putative conserved membrane protein [[Mycobacterium] stephanolepidis]